MAENAKVEKLKWDNLGYFQIMCLSMREQITNFYLNILIWVYLERHFIPIKSIIVTFLDSFHKSRQEKVSFSKTFSFPLMIDEWVSPYNKRKKACSAIFITLITNLYNYVHWRNMRMAKCRFLLHNLVH